MSKTPIYDSKLVSVLSFIGDLFLLNLLYIICSAPIITIGAAQAGLHTAARIMQDPNDGRSPFKAFFRGFKTGFVRITLGWVLTLAVVGVLFYTLYIAFTYRDMGLFIHWAVPLVCLALVLVYQVAMTLFHSQFSCTFPQLLYNSLLMVIWHPLASVLSGALMCIPMVVFLLNTDLFVTVTPLFLTVYFSLSAMGIYLLTQKGFKAVIDHFNNPEGDAKESTEDEAEEESEEESEEELVEE